jgi:hypothetical protein
MLTTPSLLATAIALASLGLAAADEPAAADADTDAAYTRVLEKRADDVLAVLKLDDPARAARVREAVIEQYRGLRRLHDARDARIKSLRDRPGAESAEVEGLVRADRERAEAASAALHERFFAGLAADLSPEQVEQVKDKLTYNKLQVTYNAYLEMLPELKPEQKQAVFDMLKQARDKSTYAGSAEEKSDIFNKYKGRVNNYLTAQGYDIKLATKRWAERREQQQKQKQQQEQ